MPLCRFDDRIRRDACRAEYTDPNLGRAGGVGIVHTTSCHEPRFPAEGPPRRRHRLPCRLMDVLVIDHPLAAARLTTMRDARTDSAAFRAALSELTMMLVYEAMRSAPLRAERIHTPVAQ